MTSFISDVIEIRENDEKGRHVVAKVDIQPGTLLIDELPYAHVIDEPCRTSFCDWCTEPILDVTKAVKCDKCKNEKLTYCSPTCVCSAYSAYHRWECGTVVQILQELNQPGLLLAVRILVQLKTEDFENANFDKTEAHETSALQSLLRLTSDENHLNADEKQMRQSLARNIADILCEKGFLSEAGLSACNGTDPNKELTGLLLEIMHRLARNRQGIWEHRSFKDTSLLQLMEKTEWHKACAVYPTSVLFNHGCLPNIYMVFLPQGRLQVRATKQLIKAGDELLHSYGMNFGDMDRAERQSTLMSQYYFTCSCEACTSDIYLQLEHDSKRFLCPRCKFALAENADCQNCDCNFEKHRNSLEDEMKIAIKSLKNDAKSQNLDSAMELMQKCEKQCHEHNKLLNELRELTADSLLEQGRASEALPICLLSLKTTKRLHRPESRRTAHALARLSKAYNGIGSFMCCLTTAAMIKIYHCHFGEEQVTKMMDALELADSNGEQH